jgi:hypothetical protein
MSKILLSILVLICIASAASSAFAFPPTVTVDATGGIYDSQSASLKLNFEPDTYDFTVALNSDAWSTLNLGTTNIGFEGYLWSLSIYQPSSGMTFLLGDNSAVFTSASDAVNNTLSTPAINKKRINHSDGGELWFYIDDAYSRENTSSVTVNVAPVIVPEPISTTLFITGGLVFAAGNLIRRKRSFK